MEQANFNFEERARSKDPITSHRRADQLSGSVTLSVRVKAVLYIVHKNPGRTAHDLGGIMYDRSGQREQLTYPHKNMKKLVDAGYVSRDDHPKGLLSYITDKGERALKGTE